MKSYSVSSVRVTRPWFGTKRFYVPMVFDPISDKPRVLRDTLEMTTVWGYESEDDAWKIVDRHMIQDDQDNYCSSGRGDREDFHADG